ncbi:hypothetical protein TGME49_263840 [Toxoplasma gondii ME49]|uniref:Uncharacterized protein n=3 Tax=Toxoplasma gondii TaxID=5811 RepID=S8F8D3_TOXGM|nr:hypothetical protein TGME49_263840 [Toxoplasma gondii ME49]EPT29783.1 hypothetical protein TGME49_263840 [Toxoplasma gondii ME49]KYF40839.1 hypothetical protein TGARI_263840 [Toxoplasma gondii ARI]|eukprot:XP_018637180.1 hypothetical protein TGME49_263840 [Toxoplasma gondii ME49]
MCMQIVISFESSFCRVRELRGFVSTRCARVRFCSTSARPLERNWIPSRANWNFSPASKMAARFPPFRSLHPLLPPCRFSRKNLTDAKTTPRTEEASSSLHLPSASFSLQLSLRAEAGFASQVHEADRSPFLSSSPRPFFRRPYSVLCSSLGPGIPRGVPDLLRAPSFREERRVFSQTSSSGDPNVPSNKRETAKNPPASGRFRLLRAVENLVSARAKRGPVSSPETPGGPLSPVSASAAPEREGAGDTPQQNAEGERDLEETEAKSESEKITDEGSHWLARRARGSRLATGRSLLAGQPDGCSVQDRREDGSESKPVTVVYAHASSMETTRPASSASLSRFLSNLLPRLFLFPTPLSSAQRTAEKPVAEGASVGAESAAREPLLSPSQRQSLPFNFVTVDVAAEPRLGAFLALPSVPALVCFYRKKLYSVLAPGASDVALLRFLKEAADLSETSISASREKNVCSRVSPENVAEAVHGARVAAATTAGGKGSLAVGSAALGSKRLTETEAIALEGAWAERKDVQCLLTQLGVAMTREQAEEVQTLKNELVAEDRSEDAVLTGGRRLFAELQLQLTGDSPPDREALSTLLSEILGSALSLPESLQPPKLSEVSRQEAGRSVSSDSRPSRKKTGYAEQWASLYQIEGYWNELETSPVCARLLAKATVALFNHEQVNLQELDLCIDRASGEDDEEWPSIRASLSESLKTALNADEPVRPLDEAVHYAHLTMKNEKDFSSLRPSFFFLGSTAVLDCPLRTASRLRRLKAARLFHGGAYEEALKFAVFAYRLECQGPVETRRAAAPEHVLGKWRDEEAALLAVDSSHDKVGGNGTEDLFDQMACARAGWPARTLLMAMYMALGAKHPAVQRSRAELEVLLGTDGFVPVVFPHTRARAGGKPIMMRGKSGKWHWLGPYWKPPWAPSNKARWPTGPEEWAWSDPTR